MIAKKAKQDLIQTDDLTSYILAYMCNMQAFS